MRAHRKSSASAAFRSGSDEQVTEATTLLDELVALEDNKDLEAAEALEASATDEKRKEVAGSIVRQAAHSLALGDQLQVQKKIKKGK